MVDEYRNCAITIRRAASRAPILLLPVLFPSMIRVTPTISRAPTEASILPSRAATRLAAAVGIGRSLSLPSLSLSLSPHPYPSSLPRSIPLVVPNRSRSFSRHLRLARVHSNESPASSRCLDRPRNRDRSLAFPVFLFPLFAPYRPFSLSLSLSLSLFLRVCSMRVIYTSLAPDHRAVARTLV